MQIRSNRAYKNAPLTLSIENTLGTTYECELAMDQKDGTFHTRPLMKPKLKRCPSCAAREKAAREWNPDGVTFSESFLIGFPSYGCKECDQTGWLADGVR